MAVYAAIATLRKGTMYRNFVRTQHDRGITNKNNANTYDNDENVNISEPSSPQAVGLGGHRKSARNCGAYCDPIAEFKVEPDAHDATYL